MSEYRSKSLSINVFSPLVQGASPVAFIPSKVSSYRHSVRAEGGYWDGAFTIRAEPTEMADWLQNGLGRHIVSKNPSLVTIWEGFVNQVTITSGPVSIIVGPLMETINRTAVTYSYLDNTAGINNYGEKTNTEEVNNLDSQAKYGIIAKYVSVSNCDAIMAQQVAETQLAEYAWPQVNHDIATVQHEPNIIVDCLGYVRWLERVVYNQTAETGDVELQQKLKSIILAEPNGFFEFPGVNLFTELIVNGNFEAEGAGGADIFASWTETAGDGTINRVTTDHKEGTACCSLDSGPTSNTLMYQDITVTAGTAYRLTFWSRDIDQDTVSITDDSGTDNKDYVEESTGDFIEDGVKKDMTLNNSTDGSSGPITNVKKTKIWATLEGGTDNDFDSGDNCTVVVGAYPARYQIYDNLAKRYDGLVDKHSKVLIALDELDNAIGYTWVNEAVSWRAGWSQAAKKYFHLANHNELAAAYWFDYSNQLWDEAQGLVKQRDEARFWRAGWSQAAKKWRSRAAGAHRDTAFWIGESIRTRTALHDYRATLRAVVEGMANENKRLRAELAARDERVRELEGAVEDWRARAWGNQLGLESQKIDELNVEIDRLKAKCDADTIFRGSLAAQYSKSAQALQSENAILREQLSKYATEQARDYFKQKWDEAVDADTDVRDELERLRAELAARDAELDGVDKADEERTYDRMFCQDTIAQLERENQRLRAELAEWKQKWEREAAERENVSTELAAQQEKRCETCRLNKECPIQGVLFLFRMVRQSYSQAGCSEWKAKEEP